MQHVQVQFANPLIGETSPVYGPYEYLDMCYAAIYTPEHKREIAYFADGCWHTDDGKRWTDFTVTPC